MTLCKVYNAIYDCVAGCPKLVTNTVHKHLSGKHLPTLPSRSCPHSEASMGPTDSLPVLLHPRSWSQKTVSPFLRPWPMTRSMTPSGADDCCLLNLFSPASRPRPKEATFLFVLFLFGWLVFVLFVVVVVVLCRNVRTLC